MLNRYALLIAGLFLIPAFTLQAQSLNSASGGDAGVPAGAVLAFALSSCPTGWSQYTAASGRSIVGTGGFSQSYRGQNYSKNYVLGERGGVRAFRLHNSEVPKITTSGGSKASPNCDYPGCSYSGVTVPNISQATYGSAFDNQDPYIALLYCRKN